MRAFTALVLGVLAALCGCAAQPSMVIRAEQNPQANLGRYRTYAWVVQAPSGGSQAAGGSDGARPAAAADWDVERMAAQLRALSDAELAARGYVVDPRQPGLLFSWYVSTRWKNLQDSFGAYSRYRAEGGGESMGDAWVSGYEEGSLVIEARDARNRQLLWYGSATAVVNPELREKRLPLAVHEIFSRWPATAGGAAPARLR